MRLEFEITHACNKNCSLCSHRIKTSSYNHTSLTDFLYVRNLIGESKNFDEVRVLGGEPLLHPYIQTILQVLLFDTTPTIWTNGLLLPKFPLDLVRNCRWFLSSYPGWNDEIVERYRNHPNFLIIERATFWNPDQEVTLSEQDAKKACTKCPTRGLRILGRNMYGCCFSESLERTYPLEQPVHKEITTTWREDFLEIPTFEACKRCFRANHIILHGTSDVIREFSHDY